MTIERHPSHIRGATTLQWCNHASFVVEYPGTRLLVDPWFSGSVFEQGWDLLCDTPPLDLDSITDVWVSHEHPDHFHPPTLRALSPEQRARIRFWFRATRDGKVAAYAQALGFAAVTECVPGERYALGPGVSLQVEPWDLFDSFAVIETPDAAVVDLNDCKTRGAWSVARLARRLRHESIDVLITQVEAGDDVQMLVEQARALKPSAIVPGASFVWFSHEENVRHNDGMSRIDRAWQRLRDQVQADVVVLYPGDTWRIGTPHDTQAALERYRCDYVQLGRGRELHTSGPISIGQLRVDAALWGSRLRSTNGERVLRALQRLGALRPALVWVTDLDSAFVLSEVGLAPTTADPRDCDVALSSSALDAVFRLPWGGNTLSVNGRSSYPAGGDAQRFRRWVNIGAYNHHGYRIGQMIPRLAADAIRRSIIQRKVAS